MSLSLLSDSEKEFYKEAYIRRLYKHGYPATVDLMRKFNKKFSGDHHLQGEKRYAVTKMLGDFRRNFHRYENYGVRSFHDKPELRKMLSAVLADNQHVDDAQENDSDEEVDVEHEQLTEDDENSDMEDVVAENDGAITILENRNEELAKTLKMKDEECQQLEEKVRSLEEALQKKSKEPSQKLKKSDVAKLEGEKRSLEEEVRSLKEALLKKSDTAKLEEKIRSLEEALHEKDQMLKTALKIQDTLSTIINKPTPQ